MTPMDLPKQVAVRRRRRAALFGAVLAALLVALVLFLRSADREPRHPEMSALTPGAGQGAASATTPEPAPPQPTEAAGPVRGSSRERTAQGNGSCPGVLPASGGACAVAAGEALICGYAKEEGAVTCVCQAAADVPATWSCTADRDRPQLATCPTQQPSVGAPCTAVGLGCVYDPGVDGTACTCQLGERLSTWACKPYLDYI